MVKEILFVVARKKTFQREIICLDQNRLEKHLKKFESFQFQVPMKRLSAPYIYPML